MPRPERWGGYVLEPDAIELWQHRDDRLHERLRFTRAREGWRRGTARRREPQAQPLAVESTVASPAESSGDKLVAILLAMAMFVLVVDTSLMNVSISAVVHDLDTTASGVQSAIALEALVSAAFILIGSKIGDLFGRKRAYILGLLGYAVGALSMTLSQSLVPIIIFWAIVGGLGASLLLPAMQSLIHGNFQDRRNGRPTRWSVRRQRSPRRWGRSSAASSRRISPGASPSAGRS